MDHTNASAERLVAEAREAMRKVNDFHKSLAKLGVTASARVAPYQQLGGVQHDYVEFRYLKEF